MKKLALPTLPKLAARERTFAVVGLMMVGLVLLDRVLIIPWWRHARQVAHEIHDLQREVATDRRLLSREADVTAKIGAYHDYLRIARAPEVEMGDITREIELIGDQSGIKLTVTPLQTTQNPPYQEHAVDVQYNGTLEEVIRFLYLVESSKKLFEVQRVALSLEKRGQDRLQGSVRLTSVAILGTARPAAP